MHILRGAVRPTRRVLKTLALQTELLKTRLYLSSLQDKQDLVSYQRSALNFVDNLRADKARPGIYRYTPSGDEALLYASVFAALLYDLTGKMSQLSTDERKAWSDYINSFQCPDGLFRDERVSNSIAEAEDWWGWRHLTLLCLMALAALGDAPRYRLAWLDDTATSSAMLQWLESLDWDERVDFTSNAVQNRIASMQFARDFMGEAHLDEAIQTAIDFLTMRCSPETGLWGSCVPATPQALTRQVQAAYHFWLLYAYESIDIPFSERALEYVLATQSAFGGYSPVNRFSSACEDIDSIDPLARFGYRTLDRERIQRSFSKALPWVLFNFNRDGGAVFRRHEEFVYGHPLMRSKKNESSVFATWFRLLSIAIMDCMSSEPTLTWNFLEAPGYQLDPRKLFHRPRLKRFNAIPTHLTEQEKFLLFNITRGFSPSVDVVELGSYLGASACFLAEGLQRGRGHLYCVDTWENDAMSEGYRDTYQEFLVNTELLSGTITPIRGLTTEVATSFTKEISLLFVDADHSYAAVTADLQSWLPKLQAGGWLLMHDWGWAEGVQRAIKEMVAPIQIDKPIRLPNLYAVRVDPRIGGYTG
ncbi:MAG: class I SAM-dependent methyltransferase [Candidatus Methanomethylicaceae archaeon]